MSDQATLETRLAEAETALHALTTGARTASVSVEGRTVTYARTEIDALRSYVQDLRARIAVLKGERGRRAMGVRF